MLSRTMQHSHVAGNYAKVKVKANSIKQVTGRGINNYIKIALLINPAS